MLNQIVVGSVIIILTIIVQVIFLGILSSKFELIRQLESKDYKHIKSPIIIILSVLWLVLGITIDMWIWAFAFLFVGEFNELEEALYFAIASFTTLGFGDVILSHQWRIMGALSAVNGLLVFGLNAAFLVELMGITWGKSRHKRK
ncbi:MAG: ion channel [Aliiglaciecola sp.]|uniref:ion channel n=1 Tax=Aliiglaciecola sp. TaxID=1872441 RepID=UPI003299662A